jgi:hypothetical protein
MKHVDGQTDMIFAIRMYFINASQANMTTTNHHTLLGLWKLNYKLQLDFCHKF